MWVAISIREVMVRRAMRVISVPTKARVFLPDSRLYFLRFWGMEDGVWLDIVDLL